MIDSSTDLARERSLEAANGTLLASIRTVLALIGYGFGVGKFYGYLHDAGLHERLDPIRSTLSFGASFIVLGTLGLLAAVVQHARVLSRIHRQDEGLHRLPGRGGQAVLCVRAPAEVRLDTRKDGESRSLS
jgi:putative membrane protein